MTLVLKRGLSWGAALLVGCAGSALSTGSAVRSGELPPLIPREVLFGNPQIMSVNLSPDGRWISYLAPDQGVLNLWVRDLDGQSPGRVLTQQRDRPQMPGYWTADGRYLISFRDGDGDENTVLVRIDPRSGASKDLTPAQGVKAVWIGADRDAPNELLVALNDRDPRFHDTYVIDLDSGERRLLYRSTDDGREVSTLWIDGGWNSVIRSQLLPDGGSAHELRLPGESDWRPFLQFDFDDTITGSGPGGFSRDGQWLYGFLSTGDDLPRLVRWSREQLEICGSDCTPEVLHRSTAGALGVALSDLDTDRPTVLQEVDLRSRLVVLDPSVEPDMARLRQLAGANDFAVVDQDLDGRR